MIDSVVELYYVAAAAGRSWPRGYTASWPTVGALSRGGAGTACQRATTPTLDEIGLIGLRLNFWHSIG